MITGILTLYFFGVFICLILELNKITGAILKYLFATLFYMFLFLFWLFIFKISKLLNKHENIQIDIYNKYQYALYELCDVNGIDKELKYKDYIFKEKHEFNFNIFEEV